MSEPRLLCNSSLSRVLLILALLCAVLAGFGVSLGPITLLPFALALLIGAMLV
jgi:hypothetical protein